MPVEYVDPTAAPGRDPEPYMLSTELGPDTVVGLLANGFPDSVAFLDRIADELLSERPDLTVRRYDKGNASAVASDDLLAGITGDCGAVIAAYGH